MSVLSSIAISYPFEENAIKSLANRAHTTGALTERLVPDFGGPLGLASAAAALPGAPDALIRFREKTQKRIADLSLPEDIVVSRVSELVRIAGARVRTPITGYVGNYLWKKQFDDGASKVPLSSTGLLIGMPGSCRKTFGRNHHLTRVFHAIDAHPRARNEWLRAAYPGHTAHAELYPDALVAQIEAELQLSDIVMVPSILVRDQMTGNGVPAAKIVVVPYGVDLDAFTPPQPGLPRDAKRRPRVVLVAQLSLRKGIPFLIEAARGLDIDVELVGNVFDGRALKSLPTNVTVVGNQTRDQLVARLQDADAFVLPAVEDAFALVVAEAAATGLPVITTPNTGAAEILDPRFHSLVDAADTAALREALRAVTLLDDDRRAEIAAALANPAPGITRVLPWADYAGAAYAAIEARLTENTAARH